MKSIKNVLETINAFKKHTPILYVVKIAVFFLAYFFTAKLGLSFDAVSGFATLIWIPSGISLAVLLLFGYSIFPAITLGAFLVNFTTGAPALVAFLIAIGNTLEALVAAYMLRRFEFNMRLERLADVLALIVVIPISCFIAATVGTASLLLGKIIVFSSFYTTADAWWIGDMISMVIITPFILTWKTKEPFQFPTKREIFETGILVLTSVLAGLVIFQNYFIPIFKNALVTYLVFPPLIWASLRFGQRAAITITFILSILAILGTLHGHGPFTIGRLSERLSMLQIFLGVIAITSMILAAVDTERKQLEERKDEFIGLASHELKTPLTSIKVFTQMLQKKFEKRHDKNTKEYLNKMHAQIDTLSSLINSLLDVSKIQSGKLEFHKTRVPLVQLVQQTVDIIQATTNHKIFFKQNGHENIFVLADKERINQVLINLLTNAIKYSPQAKKILVTVVTHRHVVQVSVRDYGIGITKDNQQKIFQRYYRVRENNNHTFPGLGIGLYITREILERHDGFIAVRSAEGKGTVFSFSLPIDR